MNNAMAHAAAMLTILLCWCTPAVAQPLSVAESNVLLEFELVTPRLGANQLDAQRWGQFFRDQGEVVRVREPLGDDEVSISEVSRGTFRIVRVQAEIDRKGQLVVPGHQFKLSNPGPIMDWLKEIKTYGAQGAPDGKPKWGLSDQQFNQVFEALSEPVKTAIQDQTLNDALAGLQIPKKYPLQIHRTAQPIVDAAGKLPVSDEVEGLSLGTALAGILVQHGLGFRPLRTPRGDIELVVESLADISDAWPVGWPAEQKPRNLIVPTLYETLPAGFENVPLEDVLHAITVQRQVPIIIARAECQTQEIDLTRKVSYPEKSRTAWALILESVVRQSKLTQSLRLDERGQPLVFVEPFQPVRAK
ncbi:MAG: hypothetical protein KDA88_20510 [Planctomycetaceae bacterium]|nr:hypothetical protein [Planctomycetaceae bacterium]MCA9030575.1 hypothetical protein [Planctomycetaceae bacterium]